MKKIYAFIILLLVSSSFCTAQCFDPDASIWKDTWASCEQSPNPIQAYGMSHWIQYDFGSIRNLSKSWIWNTNDPDKLNQGFNQVSIDYSEDGIDWIHWGEMTFPKAQGVAVYGGFPGPDLQNIKARYILLTALSNYGHSSCSGLAEIKFNLKTEETDMSPPIEDDDDNPDEVCASLEFIEVEYLAQTEAFIFWEYEFSDEEEFEEVYYLFEYGTSPDEMESEELDEAEIFLEDLLPNTTYYYNVSIICDDALISSDTEIFITPDCGKIEYIDIEFEEDEIYIFWDLPYEDIEYFLVQIVNADGEEESFEVEENELFIDELEWIDGSEISIGIECGETIIWSDPIFIDLEELSRLSTSMLIPLISENEFQLQVYPNPVSEIFNVLMHSNKNEQIRISIVDVYSKKVFESNKTVSKGQNEFEISMDGIVNGIYFLTIVGVESKYPVSERIVKLN
ncbi:MAG: T9SS type A sorting domain-containing protein [Bacteroidia bacterium]|nr:T9SS type A sorting domain-containing protein [Bacteroidia bacterium]